MAPKMAWSSDTLHLGFTLLTTCAQFVFGSFIMYTRPLCTRPSAQLVCTVSPPMQWQNNTCLFAVVHVT